MPVIGLTVADPEIAAATFKKDLDQLWASVLVKRRGWERHDADPMHTVVKVPARRGTGETDYYYIRLGAKYYDAGPPTVEFVEADETTTAKPGSKYFPIFKSLPPWFAFHHSYTYAPPRGIGQLVCFSFSADYYLSNHTPEDSQKWKQGTHTVSATLSRIAEMLSPAYYLQPSG